MEICIQKGQFKGYFATVLGTRWQRDGTMWVDVKVSALPIEYKLSLNVVDVMGR